MKKTTATKFSRPKRNPFPTFASRLRLLALALLFSQAVFAQVFDGDLTLSTQAEVDAFNYTEVTRDLRIQGNNINNLAGLSELTSIGGGCTLTITPALATCRAWSR